MNIITSADRTRLPGREHAGFGGDIGLHAWGTSLAEAFEEAALALTAAVTAAEVAPLLAVEVICDAPDIELLLVDWLNAVVYEMATRRMVFGRFAVSIAPGPRLCGTMWGEPVDSTRHAPAVEPKGATCSGLRVEEWADGSWTAGCTVDV